MESNSTKNPLDAHLGYWLRRVSNRISGTFARSLQSQQTSVAEWVVLCQIQERPGISPGDLTSPLHMTRGAVSKILDRLEAKQWVTRTTRPDDHRSQLLSLTRAGRRILPQLAAIADSNDQQFFRCLEEAERSTLRLLLMKIAEFHQIEDVPVE